METLAKANRASIPACFGGEGLQTNASAFPTALARDEGTPKQRYLLRDLHNRKVYGVNAPRSCERIYVDPAACTTSLCGYRRRRDFSGLVLQDYDRDRELPVVDIIQVRCGVEHWRDGMTWEATGIYDHMMQLIATGAKDGCRSLEDIYKRYRKLDAVFEQVRRDGRLLTRQELGGAHYREYGGILVHLGEDGRPIFGASGCHRLAIALVLGLVAIPAQLGFVHTSALPILPSYRQLPGE